MKDDEIFPWGDRTCCRGEVSMCHSKIPILQRITTSQNVSDILKKTRPFRHKALWAAPRWRSYGPHPASEDSVDGGALLLFDFLKNVVSRFLHVEHKGVQRLLYRHRRPGGEQKQLNWHERHDRGQGTDLWKPWDCGACWTDGALIGWEFWGKCLSL